MSIKLVILAKANIDRCDLAVWQSRAPVLRRVNQLIIVSLVCAMADIFVILLPLIEGHLYAKYLS